MVVNGGVHVQHFEVAIDVVLAPFRLTSRNLLVFWCRWSFWTQHPYAMASSLEFNDGGGNAVDVCFLKHTDVCAFVFPTDAQEATLVVGIQGWCCCGPGLCFITVEWKEQLLSLALAHLIWWCISLSSSALEERKQPRKGSTFSRLELSLCITGGEAMPCLFPPDVRGQSHELICLSKCTQEAADLLLNGQNGLSNPNASKRQNVT